MSILDQLIEKKDVRIYVKYRKQSLKRERNRLMKTAKPKDRGFLQERFIGRLEELSRLEELISQGKLRESAKNEWDSNNPRK